MKTCKLLLFDLDGTLLCDDKTISQKTLQTVLKCKDRGILIGVSTSRGEQNTLSYIRELQPEVLILSGGALVKYREEYIYKAEFSVERTWQIIEAAREICGVDCGITIDTIDAHYCNFKVDLGIQDQNWKNSVYTDFHDFDKPSLKICVEIFDEEHAQRLQKLLEDCDCVRFSDGYWYKFTKKAVTKEKAIVTFCDVSGIKTEEIIAFGDDYVDIGMLQLCGVGVAMGNAIDAVKEKADLIIGSNEEDGISEYLEAEILV